MASSEKAKGREVEEEGEKEKEEGEAQQKKMVEKCKESIVSLFILRRKEDVKEKESRKRARRPKVRQTLEKIGRWLFLLLLLEQSWLCVSAAAEGPQRRTEAMVRVQQEVQVKGGRWAEEIPQGWRQPKGEDRTDMKKEAKLLMCTLLNGSAWSTEKKCMRRKKKQVRCLLWLRAQAEKGGNGGADKKKSRKDGGLQRMQRETLMKQQAVRIVSTHQEEFLWQSTATWEQLLE